MTERIVELIRRFAPMSSRSREWDFLMPGPGRPRRWHGIEDDFRVPISTARLASRSSVPSVYLWQGENPAISFSKCTARSSARNPAKNDFALIGIKAGLEDIARGTAQWRPRKSSCVDMGQYRTRLVDAIGIARHAVRAAIIRQRPTPPRRRPLVGDLPC